MPDPTDFVTDLPADFEIFGDAVDASFAADEGDLLVGGTSNIFEALPIGVAGTVLTSDGDTADWAAPTAAGPNYSLLNGPSGTTLTGANTITISSISDIDKFFIRVFNGSTTSNSSEIFIRFNADSSTNYLPGGNIIFTAGSYSAANYRGEGDARAGIRLATAGTAANTGFQGSVTVEGGNSTGVKVFAAFAGGNNTGHTTESKQGVWTNSATINSVSIFTSSGNFDAGTFFVYGSA
jgi:hypothetical protein